MAGCRKALATASVVLVICGAAGFDPMWPPSAADAQDVNLDEIFRCVDDPDVDQADCDVARNLILNNCTTCHTFVPIVLQQNDAGAWNGLLDRHRDRAGHVSEEEFETIREYLIANFNDDLQPPEVPPQLLETWTDY